MMTRVWSWFKRQLYDPAYQARVENPLAQAEVLDRMLADITSARTCLARGVAEGREHTYLCRNGREFGAVVRATNLIARERWPDVEDESDPYDEAV